MLLIPAIDLKDGQCVRLRRGIMEDSTVFSDNPLEMAKQWQSQDCKRLHLVDLNGAFAGTPVNQSIIEAISSEFPELEIQIGGGIRDLKTIENYVNGGVNYVIIGTQAVKDPDFVRQACKEYPEKVMVGLDAKKGKVAINGWAEDSDIDVIELAKQFENDGVTAIIYTDIARDGMMQGVNIESTVALADAISIPVIASGGITNLDDIKQLCEVSPHGICGAITGRAIYEGTLDFSQAQAWIKQWQQENN